jgi:hypothetical protein
LPQAEKLIAATSSGSLCRSESVSSRFLISFEAFTLLGFSTRLELAEWTPLSNPSRQAPNQRRRRRPRARLNRSRPTPGRGGPRTRSQDRDSQRPMGVDCRIVCGHRFRRRVGRIRDLREHESDHRRRQTEGIPCSDYLGQVGVLKGGHSLPTAQIVTPSNRFSTKRRPEEERRYPAHLACCWREARKCQKSSRNSQRL